MSLVSSMGLGNCGEQQDVGEKVSRVTKQPCINTLFPRADVLMTDHVSLTRRGVSQNQRTIILATILGGLGCIVFVVVIFFLARYYTLRQPTRGSVDLPLEEPTINNQTFDKLDKLEKSRRKPPVPPPPTPPFPRPRGDPAPPVHAPRIPNHPYALTYVRPNSPYPFEQAPVELPYPPPPPVPAVPDPMPAPPVPVPPAPPALPPLVVPRLAHPYSQPQSAGTGMTASTMHYESLLLPDTEFPAAAGPANSIGNSSPLASSVGLKSPPSAWDSGADEAPVATTTPTASAFSRTSSTAPLQPLGDTKRQRTRR